MASYYPRDVTLDHLSNPFHKAKAGAEWLLGANDAVAGSNVWEAGGLVYGVDAEARQQPERAEHDPLLYPNLQYHFAYVVAWVSPHL